MEKGIEFGFEHYMEQIPEMGTVDPRASSPLVLAYIGDCVFDLIIKMMVAGRGNRQVHKLHEGGTCSVPEREKRAQCLPGKKSVDHRLQACHRF